MLLAWMKRRTLLANAARATLRAPLMLMSSRSLADIFAGHSTMPAVCTTASCPAIAAAKSGDRTSIWTNLTFVGIRPVGADQAIPVTPATSGI